jgi:hypothetical protein
LVSTYFQILVKNEEREDGGFILHARKPIAIVKVYIAPVILSTPAIVTHLGSIFKIFTERKGGT